MHQTSLYKIRENHFRYDETVRSGLQSPCTKPTTCRSAHRSGPIRTGRLPAEQQRCALSGRYLGGRGACSCAGYRNAEQHGSRRSVRWFLAGRCAEDCGRYSLKLLRSLMRKCLASHGQVIFFGLLRAGLGSTPVLRG